MRQHEIIQQNIRGEPLSEIIYCTQNCGVRTYLRIQTGTDGIYVAPYLEATMYIGTPSQIVDPSEIPIRETQTPPDDAVRVVRVGASVEIDAENKEADPAMDAVEPVSQTPTSHDALKSIDIPRATPDFSPTETAEGETQTPTTPRHKPKNQKIDIKGQILAVLPDDGTRIHKNVLFAKIGGTENNKYDALKKLKKDNLIINKPKGWYAKRI